MVEVEAHERFYSYEQYRPRVYYNSLFDRLLQPATAGRHTGSDWRQSSPSSSIDSCAAVTATESPCPLVAGQANRPYSRRFVNKHNPVPSQNKTLIRSARLPRNTNKCPEKGSCSSTRSTKTPSPSMPFRRSV